MAGDLPPIHGEDSTIRPSTSGQWPATYPAQSTQRPRPWLGIAMAVTAAVAVAALIVALTRPTAASPSATTTVPTYTASETAAAQRQLCDTYKLAAQAAQVDTAGTDKALARIATTNGALILEIAAANPAVDAKHRDAALALAAAYLTDTAKSSSDAVTEAEFRAALDDVKAKDAAMKQVCGGG
jgi:hypothetical protein